jgi:transcriptional regulator with PAS, ATPase and Fis domain
MTPEQAKILKDNGIDPGPIATMVDRYTDKRGRIYNGAEAARARERDAKKVPVVHTLAPSHVLNSPQHWLDQFITQDSVCKQLKDDVMRLANEDDSVIITGETGTGKELIARALHGNRRGNFVAVNCGGFPEHLFESEMFGHVKGSFTGAIGDKMGMFQEAHGGTIFIDELSLLPLFMQGKLLRALQEKTIRPVGSNTELSFDCRVVAATNQKVDWLIEQGKFQEDLYWRLSTIELQIPPLKERLDDVSLILQHLGISQERQDLGPIGLTVDIPGNVRELQRLARRIKLGLINN